MENYLVGTDDGLHWLQKNGAGWRNQGAAALPNKKALCGLAAGDRLIVSCYDDGLYFSNDGGKRWSKSGDARFSRVRCLRRLDWNGRRVLFAGIEPVGLFVSYDEGESWSELAGVRRLHETRKWTYPVPGVHPHVRDVSTDDADADALYVCIQVGGVLVGRSKGEAWEEKSDGLNLDVHRVLIDPADRALFYGGTGEEGIFVSHDAGRKWRRCGADFSWTYTVPFELWGSRRIVAGMGKGLPGAWTQRSSGAEAVLALSADGGKTWEASHPGEPLTAMIMALSFTEAENTVLAGTGVPIGGTATKGCGQIHQVDLAGGRWEQVADNLPPINFIERLT
jgi:hypothetical protein